MSRSAIIVGFRILSTYLTLDIILQVAILTLWKEEGEMSYIIARLKPMTIHSELLSELLYFNSG